MPRSLETRLVHGGRPQPSPEGAVVPPIFQTAMYEFGEDGGDRPLRYIRYGNTPDQHRVAALLASLEGAEDGLVTGSGMAAISCALLGVLSAGDHLLAQGALYGGTRDLLTDALPALGVEVTLVDGGDPGAWREALRPDTRALYLETLSNPLLRVPDLEAAVAFAREHELVSIVDNTFATPIGYRPPEAGFDLSVHSATKYLNGHSDLVAGAVLGRAELVESARHRLHQLGGALDPHACFLLARGVQTLAVRVERQATTALRLARALEGRPAVERVHHPGLASHPDHDRAARLLDGFGGMLAFEPAGGPEAARAVLGALEIPLVAPSLGGVESLVTRPAATSHAKVPREEREAAGVTDALIRMSVGIEDPDELEEDLLRALADGARRGEAAAAG